MELKVLGAVFVSAASAYYTLSASRVKINVRRDIVDIATNNYPQRFLRAVLTDFADCKGGRRRPGVRWAVAMGMGDVVATIIEVAGDGGSVADCSLFVKRSAYDCHAQLLPHYLFVLY